MKTTYENKQGQTAVDVEIMVTHTLYTTAGLHRIPVGVSYRKFPSGTSIPEIQRSCTAKWGRGGMRRSGPFQWDWVSKEA